MEGDLFIASRLKTGICHGRRAGEKTASKSLSFSFFRNIACFDLSCFFVLCNAYSVSDQKRMYTKTGIKERAERIVYGVLAGEGRGGWWNVLFLKRNEKCCKKDGYRKRYLKMRFSE